MTVSAFVALGSNLGDRLSQLRAAVEAIDSVPGVRFVRASAVYETDPVGPPQPDYLNAVVEVHASIPPEELLDQLKRIEREAGRRIEERWGPREIDLDLLLYGDTQRSGERLQLPHPEMTSRAFVLIPLAEIAPFARVPGAGLVAELVESVPQDGVRHVHPPQALFPGD